MNRSKIAFKLLLFFLVLIIVFRFLIINSGSYYRKKIYIPIAGRLNKQKLLLEKGEEYRLFIYGVNKRVKFSSSNISVADVDFTGRIYAYNTGKAIIRAKVGKKVFKCKVKVVSSKKKKKFRHKLMLIGLKYNKYKKGNINEEDI